MGKVLKELRNSGEGEFRELPSQWREETSTLYRGLTGNSRKGRDRRNSQLKLNRAKTLKGERVMTLRQLRLPNQMDPVGKMGSLETVS